MIIGIIIAVLVIAVVIWWISTSNKINRINVKIDESKSGIEIQLKKRYDVITQSMNVAKGFIKHENEIFTNLRAVSSVMSVDEINDAVASQNKAMSNLLALGEAYPELKSGELFGNLQHQLSEENAQFAASKRTFNANVTSLNNMIVSFPSSVVANSKGQKKMDFIKEENIESMKDINIEF